MAASSQSEINRSRLAAIVTYITNYSDRFAIKYPVEERLRQDYINDIRISFGIPVPDLKSLSTGELAALEDFLLAITPLKSRSRTLIRGPPDQRIYELKLRQMELTIDSMEKNRQNMLLDAEIVKLQKEAAKIYKRITKLREARDR